MPRRFIVPPADVLCIRFFGMWTGDCGGSGWAPRGPVNRLREHHLGQTRHRSVAGVHVISAESTELFTGPPDAPLQLVRVPHTGGAAERRVEGDGLSTPTPVAAVAEKGAEGTVEVPVHVSRPLVGEQRSARLLAGEAETPFVF